MGAKALRGAATAVGAALILAASAPASAAPAPLSVSGDRLLAGGEPAQLRGVNYSFLLANCAYSDPEPSISETTAAMQSWGVNTVRVPVDPYCWVGAREPDYGNAREPANKDAYPTAAAYRRAVKLRVSQFEAAGFWVDIELGHIDYMPPPIAVRFWRSLAARFAHDRALLFDPVNEIAMYEHDSWNVASERGRKRYSDPSRPPWSCWEHGCTINSEFGGRYRAPGMAQLVAAIRNAGAAKQPITLGGTAYDSEVDGWLSHLPGDRSLMLDTHRYDFVDFGSASPGNGAGDAGFDAFLTNKVIPIAHHRPVLFGEIGELDCDAVETDGYTANALAEIDRVDAAENLRIGALGWEWRAPGRGYACPTAVPGQAGPGGPLLLRSYDGTPTSSEGQAFMSWMNAHRGAGL
jgi:endoglucanase